MLQNEKIEESLDQYLLSQKEIIDARFKVLFSHSESEADVDILHQAMRYSVLGDGKRFRPILALAVCESLSGPLDSVLDTAVAVEMIHAYSLIHDDLPCMDDDDYRRDQLSCHKKFGEDIALLAGNALLTKSFEIMNPNFVSLVARFIGVSGLLDGQAMDLLIRSEKLPKNGESISKIYIKKTAYLIKLACLLGAHCSGLANQKQLDAIALYGEKVGFAFQVVDDLFDEEIYSLYPNTDSAKSFVLKSLKEAKDHLLSVFEESAVQRLFQLADFVLSRTK